MGFPRLNIVKTLFVLTISAVSSSVVSAGIGEDVIQTINEMAEIARSYENQVNTSYINNEFLKQFALRFEHAKNVIRLAITGFALDPYLNQPEYRERLMSAFSRLRSATTDPQLTALILDISFNFEDLRWVYGKQIPILYELSGPPSKTKENSDKFQFANDVVPDLTLFHGTARQSSMRKLVLKGLDYGPLYAVDNTNLSIAESYTTPGAMSGKLGFGKTNPNQILSIEIRPNAKIVDITKGGTGEVLWTKWSKVHSSNMVEFAKYYGFDIVKYPYHGYGFIIVNHSAIQSISSKLPLRTIKDAAKALAQAKSPIEFAQIKESLSQEGFTSRDLELLKQSVSKPQLTCPQAFL